MELQPKLPCRYRVIDDMGSGFAMGCIGGAVLNFFKGFRNRPSGFRLSGGLSYATMRSPANGGNFAAYGGVYTALDCILTRLRGGRDDIWNAVICGSLAGVRAASLFTA